jgi:hypothetical protein
MQVSLGAVAITAAVILSSGNLLAQRGPPAKAHRTFQSEGYRIVDIGQNYRHWTRVGLQTNHLTSSVWFDTNNIVEISPGLYRPDSGGWVLSKPELVTTNGGVLARGANHTVFFPSTLDANANPSPVIHVVTPGHKNLKFRVYGLAYEDSSTGTNVLIAQLGRSAAIVASNTVRYPHAFSDFNCSLEYRYTLAGLSQNIIIHERPASLPEDFGLNPATTHLVAITELVAGPEATTEARSWISGRETMHDQTISLGDMTMVPGKAFPSWPGKRQQTGAAVAKQFELLGGKRVISEHVRFAQIKDQLLKLPLSGTTGTNASAPKATRYFAQGTLPAPVKTAFSAADHSRETASVGLKDGLVLDWELVSLMDPPGDFCYDSTYFLSGECHLSSATFCGGVCVKFDMGSSLYVDGPLAVAGGYGGVLLTSINDDANGDWIEGSTGDPQDCDYGPALVYKAPYTYAATHFSAAYACPGVVVDPNSVSTVIITADDPVATKGTSDTGSFTISRIDGDWSAPLLVYYIVGGSAGGSDYTPINNCCAEIPADEGSVAIPIYPASESGDYYESTVVLSLFEFSAMPYVIGSPAGDTVAIYDPSAAVAASILYQPGDQTVYEGQSATFTATVQGDPAPTYQWNFNGTDIPGATDSSFTLNSAQTTDAGSYALTVSNQFGSATSSNATLTVLSGSPPPPCAAAPSSVRGWWSAEGDATDMSGLNNGSLVNGATFASGEVGQAFTFDGVSSYVSVPRSASLDLGGQFTIEFWMKPDSSNPMTSDQGLVASDFWLVEISEGYQTQMGVNFCVSTNSGSSFVRTSEANSGGTVVTAGAWHHVAAVYDGSHLTLYVDGTAGNPITCTGTVSAMLTNSFVTFGSEDGRTSCSSCTNRYFNGLIDEITLYTRALSGDEIQSIYNASSGGKCRTLMITASPVSQAVCQGSAVTFTAVLPSAIRVSVTNGLSTEQQSTGPTPAPTRWVPPKPAMRALTRSSHPTEAAAQRAATPS